MESIPSINDIASLGVPVLLTLICNLFAEGLKRAAGEGVNRWLPLILMLLGGVTYPCVASVSDIKVNAANPTIYLIMLGVAIGGLSVGLNQLVRQFVLVDGRRVPYARELWPPLYWIFLGAQR